MDTQQPTFDQDLSTIVAQLPPPIRAFFASGKVEIIAKNLMQKNKLHIDQGAIIGREIILLLLGLKNAAEFVKTLSEEAKLDAQTVDGITRDINAQIFVPLREEEMKSGGMKTSPAPGLPQIRKPATPSGTPPSHFHLQNKIAPPPRPATPPSRPMDNRKLLEDHEEPHIEFKKASPPPNLPGAIYHPPIPKPPIPSQIVTPSTPVKSRSADPYREPIDEK